MDFFTAGIAVIATQVCMAMAMAGIYFIYPKEQCTRYWAIGQTLIAVGVLIVIVNAGAMRFGPLALANSCLIWGVLFQMWGVQAFYGKQCYRFGVVVGTLFMAVFGALILSDAGLGGRVMLFSCTLLGLLSLTFRVMWRGGAASERTVSYWMVMGALGLLIFNNVARIAVVLSGAHEIKPISASTPVILFMYLVPLVGSLMSAIGLMLMYFERVVREKDHLATHDDLTGLLNRRAIVAGGEREVIVASRSRQPLAVALIDVDYFKSINDRLGHEAGDAVLADLAEVLKRNCRVNDLVGRYGGEEFCVVLPGVDASQFELIGERLMAAVRQYRYLDNTAVTVSAGYALLLPDHADRSWKSLVNRADKELYKAKGMGRDRFSISERSEPDPATVSLVASG